MQPVADAKQAEMDALRAEVRELRARVARLSDSAGLQDTVTGDGQVLFGSAYVKTHPEGGMVVDVSEGDYPGAALVLPFIRVQTRTYDEGDVAVPESGDALFEGTATGWRVTVGDYAGGLGSRISQTYAGISLALDSGGGPVLCTWDGSRLSIDSGAGLRLVGGASDLVGGLAGSLYYRTDLGAWRGYNGTWVTIGAGVSPVANIALGGMFYGGPFP